MKLRWSAVAWAIACILLVHPAAAGALDAGGVGEIGQDALGAAQAAPEVGVPQLPATEAGVEVAVDPGVASPIAIKTAPVAIDPGLGLSEPAPSQGVGGILSSPAAPVAGAAAVGASAAAVRFLPALLPVRRLLGRALVAVGGMVGIGLFSRIQPDEVLEHGTRAQIVDLLSASPGLTLQEVQARLGVAWGTAVHHVRLLEQHGEVVSVRQGPRKLLFAANTPEARSRGDLALIRTETAHRIAATVRDRPGIHQVELCERLGLRSPAASKHLSRLEAAGLIEVQRDGGRCHYGPTPRLESALGLGQPVAAARSRPARPWAALGPSVHEAHVAVAAQ